MAFPRDAVADYEREVARRLSFDNVPNVGIGGKGVTRSHCRGAAMSARVPQSITTLPARRHRRTINALRKMRA